MASNVQSFEYGFNEMGYLNAASADGTVIKVGDPPVTHGQEMASIRDAHV